MNSNLELADEQFAQEFKQCTLAPSLFNHEAHLRLAWIHLQQSNVEQAIQSVCSQITAFVNHVGGHDKYNLTLTVAAVRVVHHFMSKSHSKVFPDFIDEFPQLKSGFKALIQSHYSMDIFNSPEAKATYLAPDLASFK